MAGVRLVRVAHHALVLVIVVASALAISAQAVVDPRYVEFAASNDHSRMASDGVTPLVASYSLSVYPQGSSTLTTVNLGKPAPDANNLIRVDFLPLLPAPLTPGVTYEARVTAVGPGGVTASTASNGFSFTVPCAPGISPSSRSVSASAVTGSVAVSAGTGCGWNAASNAGWITLTSGASGSGNGTVNYSVASNPSSGQRVGTMTIAGATFTITQSGATCSVSLSPSSASPGASGGSGSASVTAPAGCAWTAASNATSWLTVTGGSSGSGNGTVSYSVGANSQGQTRQGTITIGGQAFTVNQDAASCTYSLSSGSTTIAAAGGTGSTSLTATSGCSWSAVSSAPSWLTVTGGASGTGSGTVTFSAAANSLAQTRQATISVGGQTFTVDQAAATVTCSFAVAPGSSSVGAGASTGSTAVTAPAGCVWSASSGAPSWLTVTAGATGSGNGTVFFSAAANSQAFSRQGVIAVGGQSFTVNQAAATCSYSITPTTQSVVAAGGTGSSAVTSAAGCNWTAQSNAAWITITSGSSGNGNGNVAFTVAPSTSSSQRSGTLSIAGRTFTVTQAASTGCQYSLNPATVSVSPAGGSGSTSVTTTTSCMWTATTSESWITMTTASGWGSQTVTFTFTPNTGNNPRNGRVTISGQTLTVVQTSATSPGAPRGLKIKNGT